MTITMSPECIGRCDDAGTELFWLPPHFDKPVDIF
jgi:hypothetical protein